jgi:hypothetical protein
MEWLAARAAGLFDDYANLVAVVGDLQDRTGHAGLDGLDNARPVIRREAGYLVDCEARRSERYLQIDHGAAVLGNEDPDPSPGEGVLSRPAPSAPAAADFVAPAGTAADATATAAASDEAAPFVPAEASENWNPDETADAAIDPSEDDELAVLQALERGEIGVDEAAERLDRSRE